MLNYQRAQIRKYRMIRKWLSPIAEPIEEAIWLLVLAVIIGANHLVKNVIAGRSCRMVSEYEPERAE